MARHAEDRLFARAVPAAAERGFALLRNRSALVSFLEELTRRGEIPDGTESVALPLSDDKRPARLLVDRRGTGITCLGPKMDTAAPAATWASVDRFAQERAQLQRAQLAAFAHEKQPEEERPLVRAVRDAYRLSRADFDVVQSLAPLVGPALSELVVVQAERLRELSTRTRAWPLRDAKSAEATWHLYSAACIALVAAPEEPTMLPAALAAFGCGDSRLSARALWVLARQPERTLGAARQVLDEAGPEAQPLLARPLAVIAARSAEYRDAALALLDELAERPDDIATTRPLATRPGLVFAMHLPLLLPRYCPAEVRDMLPTDRRAVVARARARSEQRGARLDEALDEMHPWFARMLGLLDVERAGDGLRAGARHADKRERVRALLWRHLFDGLRQTTSSLPVEVLSALVAAPPEALVPRDAPDVRWSLPAGRRYVARVLPEVLQTAAAKKTEPQRSGPPAAGRNDPCPCGSGKKFKRCHGRPGALPPGEESV